MSTEGVSIVHEDEELRVCWHDFQGALELPSLGQKLQGWLEVCVNFSGLGRVILGKGGKFEIAPGSVAHFIRPADDCHDRVENGKDPHRFLSLQMSRGWLRSLIPGSNSQATPVLQSFLENKRSARTVHIAGMDESVKGIAQQLASPRIAESARPLWVRAKVLEIASHVCFPQEVDQELFCHRQKRVARERVDRVIAALERDLENPPTLQALGREVGCSPFYISRVFSEEKGMTISRYLRKLRLDKAAELLRSGEYNVTEAAMAVGYSSLSHFSKAFAEQFGACPCVFPLATR